MYIRLATIKDLPAITAIYNSTIAGRKVTADTEEVSVSDRLDWFHAHDSHRRPLWVMEADDPTIAGWVSLQDFYGRVAYNGTAEISIYVAAEMRGKGIGKKLMQHVINSCPTLHIHTLLGFIFGHNNESIQLFEKSGFNEWGHFPEVAEMDQQRYDLKIFGLKITQ